MVKCAGEFAGDDVRLGGKLWLFAPTNVAKCSDEP